MAAQVLIIHGWSDKSQSFHPLRDFLISKGVAATEIWLADYISMEDDVEVQDVVRRMDLIISDLIGRNALHEPFDVIVHSTGALVAREWIARQPLDAPSRVRRLVMLAPANFGSKLAALGKSMIGRVLKGWDNWFQTGEQMLRALELGSPYQWFLTQKDLLDRSGDTLGPYGAGRTWPFVIIGSRAYASGLQQIINEDGSDGTVRVAAGNMNVVGMTVDFSSSSGDRPTVKPWASRVSGGLIPFAVLPERDHSLVTRPDMLTDVTADGDKLGKLILQALGCQSDAEYAAIQAEWDAVSQATAALATDDTKRIKLFPTDTPPASRYDQFFQVLTWVHDEDGLDVNDYFLEFYSPDDPGEDDAVLLHEKVIADVHTDTLIGAYRCLYLNRDKLLACFYGAAGRPHYSRVAMSISASNPGPSVKYFDFQKVGAKGEIIVHAENIDDRETLSARLFHNRTHFVEIIVPRRPALNVFGLSQDPAN